MSQITVTNSATDITAWAETDAKKAAQIATSIGNAAVDIARRASDLAMLETAVETQVKAQADFVAWWDRQEKDKGAAQQRRFRSETALSLKQ